jgi:hypothetical protein
MYIWNKSSKFSISIFILYVYEPYLWYILDMPPTCPPVWNPDTNMILNAAMHAPEDVGLNLDDKG